MELIWQQTRFAWIAARPEHIDDRGKPVTTKLDAFIQTLCACLLQYGGTHVCIPFDEKNIELLLRRGQLMAPPEIELHPGEARRCHANSADLWQQHRKLYRIATGYALTEADRMWRQHSWVWRRDGYLIETTEPRSLYFGVVLNSLQAFLFVRNYL